jgi:hypothetical protein
MKIRASSFVDIVLSDEQVKTVTLDYIFSKFNWKKGYFIEDGNVFQNVSYTGSHHFSEKKLIRAANNKDYFVSGIINCIELETFD